MLSISLLGDFCVRHDGAPVTDLDAPRLQSLLAYLVLHREAPQPRGHLAYLFWPDTTEAQARTNLRYVLHHLRRGLPDADSHIGISAQSLQWRSGAAFTLDVADFDATLEGGERALRAGDPAGVRASLEAAVALYKGDLLPSCYDDWIIPVREGLRQAHLAALERLAHLLEEGRDYRAAIGAAQRLLRHDPLHEAAYRRLIRLHALNGDRAGALRVYHTCATALQRELDVKPSAATREAYERLLGAEMRDVEAGPATTAFSPLVGREREWAQLQRAWRAAAAGGEGHVVMLAGEAGIGKTRLAEELHQWAARQGITCAAARCYAAEGRLAYAPVTAWLRAHPLPPLEDAWLAEVARLMPEALASRPAVPQPGPLTEAWQRERLFEALARAMLGRRQPLLLMIDDLQWCDPDTLDWLHFLLRFDRGARLLLVGAYRPEEIGEGHPLVALLAALRHDGQVTEANLEPLDEAATCALAGRVAGRELDPGILRRLYRETEGNPLFVIETVRAGLPAVDARQRGEAGSDPSVSAPAGAAELPPKVRSVLEARLTQVSPQARELAGAAAAIGREFGFRLLARASGQDEEALVHALDELWQRRIVREHGADAYDFSHDKLREVAYGGLSPARRRILHRDIAGALVALHASALDPVSHQVAAHYERAGLPEQAAPYYLAAAEVARRVWANEEALALLRRGLALAEGAAAASAAVDAAAAGTAGGEPKDATSARLWEGIGDLLELKAAHEEALHAYGRARVRVLAADRLGQARLHRKVGAVKREQRLYTETLAACRRAEAALGEPPEEDAAAWRAEWIEVQVDRVWAHYWLAQWPEMQELVRMVQPVVQASGGDASLARFLMASIMMQLRRDRYTVSDAMVAEQREALRASRACGDPKHITDCQFELGFLHLWRRELDAAAEQLLAALSRVESSGDAWMRTLSLTYLTVLWRFRGQVDRVVSHAQAAQEAAEAANMPAYVAAAKGNRAWAAWRQGDVPAAERLGREALLIWQQSPLAYPFWWQALWPLIAAELARGLEEEAWLHVQAMLEPKQQRLPDELNAMLEAAVQARADQAGAARGRLDRSLTLARELGYL